MSSCCSTALTAFGDVSVLDFTHSNRCVVVSPWCFHLYFVNNFWYWILLCVTCHLCIFFGEVSVKIFGPFSVWVVYIYIIYIYSYCWVLRVLCIFWIAILYQLCFFNYFLPVCVLSSHSLDMVFHRQNFHILMKSSLWFISFIGCKFGIVLWKSSPYPR